MRTQNPKYALSSSSSLVIFSHPAYFSFPITCFAYRLLCSTIVSMSDGVNIRLNISEAVSGTGTVGPTKELKLLMISDIKLEDQSVGRGGVAELAC